MRIVMNTRYHNPNLPVIPLPGFSDNFNRPAANTLGATSAEGRVWRYSHTPWVITENDTATNVGGGTAHVDALTPNGMLSATLATPQHEELRCGLALRVQDAENFIYAVLSSTGAPTIYSRVNESNTNLGSGPTVTLAPGDVFSAILDGPEITVLINSEVIVSATTELFQTETRHGLFAWNSKADAEWDAIEFTTT